MDTKLLVFFVRLNPKQIFQPTFEIAEFMANVYENEHFMSLGKKLYLRLYRVKVRKFVMSSVALNICCFTSFEVSSVKR